VDTHVDTTQRIYYDQFDLARRHEDGSVDIPRLRGGGVTAVFFAIWVPGNVTGPPALERALAQIAAIELQVSLHVSDLLLARTARDIRHAHRDGRIAILMGLEGGHMIDDDLAMLGNYASLGVRYVTLTHIFNTNWADSCTERPSHHGLTDFGKDVIREMNRLGLMVDVSHASDKTFYDALAVSDAPLIASHSSCRALCDAQRNLSDEMMRALASKGGVVQINFHVAFLSQEYRDAMKARPGIQMDIERETKRRFGGNESRILLESDRLIRAHVAAGNLPRVGWEEIVAHIDHAVRLMGADHVGIGSDFDGANMPYGMEDASYLPKIANALVDRGYSDADIRKILGGNTLRLMQDVETVKINLGGIE
jgi:membrane dipeptidase